MMCQGMLMSRTTLQMATGFQNQKMHLILCEFYIFLQRDYKSIVWIHTYLVQCGLPYFLDHRPLLFSLIIWPQPILQMRSIYCFMKFRDLLSYFQLNTDMKNDANHIQNSLQKNISAYSLLHLYWSRLIWNIVYIEVK
jgi:hypothetical protein